MDCWNMAVSGEGCTYFHVSIQSVVSRGGSCLQGFVDFSGGEKAFHHILGHLFNGKTTKNHMGSN